MLFVILCQEVDDRIISVVSSKHIKIFIIKMFVYSLQSNNQHYVMYWIALMS